jgi:hypothetical protein
LTRIEREKGGMGVKITELEIPGVKLDEGAG